ncbi:MAG: RsmE family RNA methyltransferase [Anaerolineae bacterium]
MTPHRFFIPSDWIQGDQVMVTGPQAHQMIHVLRLRPGDEVIVLDNSGWEIRTRLVELDRDTVKGEVLQRQLASSEPRTKISLYQGVLKSKKFELILQKGTELGLVEFVPVIAERCVVSDLDAVEKKYPRWESIIQEAAEQCGRGRKPVLRPALLFLQACERAKQSRALSLIPWEGERRTHLRQLLRHAPSERRTSWPPFSIKLLSGPAGGCAPAEVIIARNSGLVPVSLGPRILRAETAGLVAATAILYELGDLG